MKFSKLVRDKIPEIIEKNGRKPITHVAQHEEYKEALAQKLNEEVGEFLENPSIEEAADILEVLDAICALENKNLEKLEEVRQKKAKERGRFKKRIILDRIEQ